MLDQYMPGVRSEWTSVIEEDLGEMIEAGQRIGAAVAQMDQRIGMQITLPPDAKRVKPNLDTSKPHCIVVDGSGVRYMRESGAPTDICRKMLERNRQVPAVPSFMIVDSQYINTRSEEHTSELQSLMRISYAVFCLQQKHKQHDTQ